MGWGTIPDDHELNAGMVGLQTSHRYGNATFLESDFVLGIGNRWANRHTGYKLDVYTKGRTFVHVDIEPTQIGKIFAPDYGIAPTPRPRWSCSSRSPRAEGGRPAARPPRVDRRVPGAQGNAAPPYALRQHPDQAAARLRGDEPGVRPRDPLRHHHRSLADRGRADAARLPAPALDQLRSGGPAGLDHPGRAGRATADPEAQVVALSGDYDFQSCWRSWRSARSTGSRMCTCW